MVKYILFDLDGVLVDARELHYQAFNRALAKFGYTVTRDEHLSTYDGLSTRRKLELLTQHKGLSVDLYDAIWQEKQAYTQAIINQEFIPDERMQLLLAQLRKEDYRLAVCSNSIRDSVKLMLARKGLLDYFEFFLSNQDVRHHKPHPEMYLRAMIGFGARPAECLVVEDSHHGREAALAAGAHLCGVKNTDDVTYDTIKAAIDKADAHGSQRHLKPKWQGGDLRIVIPLAGEGKSYARAGFTFPKPLVDIHGKPMVQWVVENINAEALFIFIVLREQYEKYHLHYLLHLIAPGCEIVILDQPTQGAALSVLRAAHLLANNTPLTIVNCDQILEWNSNEFFYAMAADECDGGIVTFESTHPKWSFIRLGDNGFVVQTAEKIPISNQATPGVYYFKRGDEFIAYAQRMVDKGITTNGEYFVCPVYNEYIKDGKKIRAFPIKKMWSFATPEDLTFFLQNQQLKVL